METAEGQTAEVVDAGADPLAGTPFKSVEELAKGYDNLNRRLGEQGNELGTYKKHAETLAEALKSATAATTAKQTPKPEAAPVDYAGQREAVQQEIMALDPMGEGYQRQLATLIGKANKLSALEQHEKTLNAASSIFKQELDERDVKATHKEFYAKNPTFNTPEMQARIKEYLAADTTGMSDPLAAYYQIQRDDIASEKAAKEAELEDVKKRLALTEGKAKTGTVITKSMSLNQQTQKPPKATGKALDEGMRAALAALT